MTRKTAGIVLALVAAGAGAWLVFGRSGEPPSEAVAPAAPASPLDAGPPAPDPAAASFVGSAACKSCHAAQFTSWSASQHAQAMQEATPEHVLARVDGAKPRLPGVAARFFREGDALKVEAEGPSGKPETYEVPYTFGVSPLQQYLARFPDGRLQALPIAWDTRPASEQGQRWLQLLPDVRDYHDQLHWTGRYQNWNMMCAECHVTGYVKAYDAQKDSYASRWSEIGVGCEACHGPASAHLAWTKSGAAAEGSAHGFARGLKARGEFAMRAKHDRIAARTDPVPPDANAECAACHARAGTIDDGLRQVPRTALTQHHRPTLMLPPEYYPTGEQHEEVFVWGSFAASKMAGRGVTCGDCHEPHSGAPLAADNTLCTRCHQAAAFDAPAHHHHAQGSDAARCVSCHMTATRYMGIDERRDHSFQLPRPDLTIATGSPNACNSCHDKEKPEWAAAALDGWFGDIWRARRHWATAFASGARHSSAGLAPLADFALDSATPAIVRASALRMRASLPRALPDARLLALMDDPQPLVRVEALSMLAQLPPSERWRRGEQRLQDSDRLVRLKAAEMLADLPPVFTEDEGAKRLTKAVDELTRSLEAQADFPANATQLAQLLMRRGDLPGARRWVAHALARDAQFATAYMVSAEIEREAGDNAASARVLEQGLARLPKAANLHYAHGLALVRLEQKPEALKELERAIALAPDDGGYVYTYVIALHNQGDTTRALELLERTVRAQPENGQLIEEILRIGVRKRDRALLERYMPSFERLFPTDHTLPALRAAYEQVASGR